MARGFWFPIWEQQPSVGAAELLCLVPGESAPEAATGLRTHRQSSSVLQVRQDAGVDVAELAHLQEDSYARAGGGLASSWPRESAMNAAQLGAFLEERRYCVLATTNAAGRPLARPLAFSVLGSSFWFATVAGARLRNLKRMPWASVVIEDGDGRDHRAVAADGPVTITEQPSPGLLDIWQQRHDSRAEWAAAWFELRPQRLVSYSARSGGG